MEAGIVESEVAFMEIIMQELLKIAKTKKKQGATMISQNRSTVWNQRTIHFFFYFLLCQKIDLIFCKYEKG